MTNGIAGITIGRNEGARLKLCLASLQGKVAPIVYVDSGSTDGSIEAARAAGAEVVELDLSIPFTAARARNEGIARLTEIAGKTEFVQFLDGDCELVEGWIETARDHLSADPGLAAVCGRRRERYPTASLWNGLIDAEWDTPIGEAEACGGDAMFRRAALDAVGGYRADLIAGEEPEMCLRMRQKGWRILRVDAEMTLHDAAITRASQWWKRNQRAGHAYAESATLHANERFRALEVRRALLWGAGPLVAALLGAFFLGPLALVFLLAWPLQIVRLVAKGVEMKQAVFLTLGKVPEAYGVFGYHWGRLTGQRRRLIEYK